jgi:hypothetical protein
VNVPAFGNILLKLPPGGIEPESQAPSFAVEVWDVVSLLVQVTVEPGATFTGFGAYAVVVKLDDPGTIDTGVPLPVPPDGPMVGPEDDEPQPTDDASINRKRPNRSLIFFSNSPARHARVLPVGVTRVRCGVFE